MTCGTYTGASERLLGNQGWQHAWELVKKGRFDCVVAVLFQFGKKAARDKRARVSKHDCEGVQALDMCRGEPIDPTHIATTRSTTSQIRSIGRHPHDTLHLRQKAHQGS
jgi:hypothetical protein